jgi:hypothetical protein
LIGFTPIDQQVNLSQELRIMFKYVVPTNSFGVVAAAIQGNVDCEDYISHLIVLTPSSGPRFCE